MNMHDKLEQRVFLLLLSLVTLTFLFLLRPFYAALFWACVIGLLFSPLQKRLLKRWGRRPSLCALTTLLICVVMCIIPALFVLASFFKEGLALYQSLQSQEMDPGAAIDRIRQAFPVVQSLFDSLNIDLDSFKKQLADSALSASRFIAQNAVQLGQETVNFFVHLGLMLYVAFFMLRDGQQLVDLLIRALPLGHERQNLLLAKFAEVTRATVKGNLAVAAVQGALGGAIFWILSIPGPLLWGVVMLLLSLIPVVGAGLIWLPAAIYLLAVGKWIQGVILIAFGAGVIGLADNILRPTLVGRDTKLPDYVVLLSTLGGFVMFGLHGFVVGPLIAALFMAVWGIFIRDFKEAKAQLEE